ncbi:MAG TPA: hypothetical protein PLT28_00295 [Saprospiraceae bacterium]|nr:hypothetical protein [Saprospiraceae bacterium]
MTLSEWLGDENQVGIDIMRKKYMLPDESLDQWFERVSGGNQDIKKLIVEKKFLFGGRILANRGLEEEGRRVTLSNCYVDYCEDNLESIFDCAKHMARTYSAGGGVGVDISKLSPRGAHIRNAAKETSGAVSFMDLFSMTTGLISQRGRRGALMISMSCEHPDIQEFIDCKTDLNRVTKANISVRMTDAFMQAADKNEKFVLTFERPETGEIITKEVNAHDIVMQIAKNNWNFAEPGMLFWDKINHGNILSEDPDFEYAGVNPCA